MASGRLTASAIAPHKSGAQASDFGSPDISTVESKRKQFYYTIVCRGLERICSLL
jgi:hypothetical protein